MSPYFAYFLGILTILFILLLIYAVATISPTFLATYYNPAFCSITNPNNTPSGNGGNVTNNGGS